MESTTVLTFDIHLSQFLGSKLDGSGQKVYGQLFLHYGPEHYDGEVDMGQPLVQDGEKGHSRQP